ncbi:MAG: hypothetical protein H7321_02110 [Bacteroidia bacterium]|nr:hypothetical protein [Bacteroidia bacterium]
MTFKFNLVTFLVVTAFVFQTDLLFAQNNSFRGPGILRRSNVKILAQNLSKNRSSDSEKIYAFHYWITHHIRYDVKKYLKGDLKTVSTKKIMRRRRAICTGYSQLFNGLCAEAGIKSVTVGGYTKNINVDICDSFYLEDHAWNAVYYNDEWRLIDNTWDAGYVKYYKRTFRGSVKLIITLGSRTIYRYKPHFKFYPTKYFYNRSGTFFMYDHFAGNEIWQLCPGNIRIDSFKHDSSYYYKSKRYSDVFGKNGSDAERNFYFESSDTDRLILDGFSKLKLNQKNHQAISVSYLMLAARFFNNIDKNSLDTTIVFPQIDSVLYNLNFGLSETIINNKLLSIQTGILKENVAEKNKMHTIFNSTLMKHSRKIKNESIKGYKFSRKFKLLSNASKRKDNAIIRSVKSNTNIYKSHAAKQTKVNDSIKAEITLNINDSLIRLFKIECQNLKDSANVFLANSIMLISKAKQLEYSKSNYSFGGNAIRIYGYDDFDSYNKWLNSNKKQIILYKKSNKKLNETTILTIKNLIEERKFKCTFKPFSFRQRSLVNANRKIQRSLIKLNEKALKLKLKVLEKAKL